MKREDLMDAIGQADDNYILEADEQPSRRRRPNWKWYSSIAACLCLVGLGLYTLPQLLDNSSSSGSDAADMQESAVAESEDFAAVPLAVAVYPELAQEPLIEDYPDTEEGLSAYDEDYSAYFESSRVQEEDAVLDDDSQAKLSSALNSFVQQTVPLVLDGDDNKNKVYSPANLYYALGMLSETITGEVQSDLLTLLGLEEDSISETLSILWNQFHQDNGISKTVLANSVWVNSSVADSLNQALLEQLATDAYASSYQVEMGTDIADQAIAQWINQQTGGLLSDQSGQLTTSPDTVLSLVSTLYFYDQWTSEFYADNNTTGTFTCGDGSMVDTEYMHRTDLTGFVRGDHYYASSLFLKGNDRMVFILPDKGTSPEELLEDPDLLSDVLGNAESSYGEVIWSVPKFDVSSNMDLSSTLMDLGLGSLFDSTADFSPLGTGLFISSITQSARVLVDEQGVSATSYTVISYDGASLPKDTCKMDLNRPFLFVITEYVCGSEVPLYVGIVNTP